MKRNFKDVANIIEFVVFMKKLTSTNVDCIPKSPLVNVKSFLKSTLVVVSIFVKNNYEVEAGFASNASTC